MNETPSIKEIVEFGLDSIPAERTVEVQLRSLVYINQVLSELNRFFHQPMNYQNLEALKQFLGTKDNGGAYSALSEAYYEKIRNMLPSDVEDALSAGCFEHPNNPAYYQNDV